MRNGLRRALRVWTCALGVLMAISVTGVVAAGCTDRQAATGAAPSPSAAAVQRGGILRVGSPPGAAEYDPVLGAGASGDVLVCEQVLEGLVALGQDFTVVPALARDWSSADGRVWQFTLREDVEFSNGASCTAADVVYSFNRLRSIELGSPLATEYATIESVVATDRTHVVFSLTSADADFPAMLTDHRAKVMCRTVKDPMTQLVGTGPFMLTSGTSERRAVLSANPTYWGRDASGAALPYVDRLAITFSTDRTQLLEGLKSGRLDWVGDVTAAERLDLEDVPGVRVETTETNQCVALQMRCDVGPAAAPAFRQALMAGTDREAIVDAVAPEAGRAGNGTLVGPAYRAYYSDEQVAYDPEGARRLLAEAGYAAGVSIELVAPDLEPLPAVAAAWQAQMERIGVIVEVRTVPAAAFFSDEGANSWRQVPFSLLDYASRPVPLVYFREALTSAAPLNVSRWANPEFDDLIARIPPTMDDGERANLYERAQAVLQADVPMLNLLVVAAGVGQSTKVEGVNVAPTATQTSFKSAALER